MADDDEIQELRRQLSERDAIISEQDAIIDGLLAEIDGLLADAKKNAELLEEEQELLEEEQERSARWQRKAEQQVDVAARSAGSTAENIRASQQLAAAVERTLKQREALLQEVRRLRAERN